MRLYHNPISSNARRPLMTALHLGLALELVEINLLDYADRQRLAAVNPNGKLPVLANGDFLLSESCAIMQYLADQVPGQTLYPTAPAARADVNRWLFWSTQHFSPAVSVLAWERCWKSMAGFGSADPVEVTRGEGELDEYATILDRHLAGRTWIAGESLSLADFCIATPLMYRDRAQLALDQFHHIDAWFERVRQVPAWRDTDVLW